MPYMQWIVDYTKVAHTLRTIESDGKYHIMGWTTTFLNNGGRNKILLVVDLMDRKELEDNDSVRGD